MYDSNFYNAIMKKSHMTRDDWVYIHHKKTVDNAVNEKLKNDPKMKKLGIKDSQDFYNYAAQKYIEED